MSFLDYNTEGSGDFIADIVGDDEEITNYPISGLPNRVSQEESEAELLGGLDTSAPLGVLASARANKYQDEIARADAHMQQVIASLIARQQQPSRAEQMAIWSGTGGGSFGEMMGKGLANTAALTATRENNLDNLRIKAAQLEQQSIRNRMLDESRQQAQMYGLAKYGLTVDENGRLVVDPVLSANAAKIKAAGAPNLGTEVLLTPEEKKAAGFAPKDIVKNTKAGPVLVKKSGDELSSTEKAKARKFMDFTKSTLPRLNSVIDRLESGAVGESATGIPGAIVGATNVVGDQLGLGTVAPEVEAHRQMVGALAQDLVRATERGSERLSDADAAAITPYLPDNTLWAGDQGQLTKAKELRRILQEKAKTYAEAMGEDYIEDINALNTQVAPRSPTSEKTNLQTGNVQYPIKMKKYDPQTGKNVVAIINNDEEMAEASAEGFQ